MRIKAERCGECTSSNTFRAVFEHRAFVGDDTRQQFFGSDC
jgi:hypothetical protein